MRFSECLVPSTSREEVTEQAHASAVTTERDFAFCILVSVGKTSPHDWCNGAKHVAKEAHANGLCFEQRCRPESRLLMMRGVGEHQVPVLTGVLFFGDVQVELVTLWSLFTTRCPGLYLSLLNITEIAPDKCSHWCDRLPDISS